MTAVVTVLIQVAQFKEYFDDALLWSSFISCYMCHYLGWFREPTWVSKHTLNIYVQGGVKVILELSNKNCDHGSHIQEIQLRKASRLKLCVYYT